VFLSKVEWVAMCWKFFTSGEEGTAGNSGEATGECNDGASSASLVVGFAAGDEVISD
jgi:hypothetical protein